MQFRITCERDHRRKKPAAKAPAKVAVGLDGGRINTRKPGCGPGVHEPGWREDKIGILQELDGPSFATDPHSEPPASFQDREHVKTLVKRLVVCHELFPLISAADSEVRQKKSGKPSYHAPMQQPDSGAPVSDSTRRSNGSFT